MWQKATAAAQKQWTVHWRQEVRLAASALPFREVDPVLRALLCLGAFSNCGPTEFDSFLLSCAFRSSSRTLPWERLMKSGLDLCNASCQNHKYIALLEKTFKHNPCFKLPVHLSIHSEACRGKKTPKASINMSFFFVDIELYYSGFFILFLEPL